MYQYVGGNKSSTPHYNAISLLVFKSNFINIRV